MGIEEIKDTEESPEITEAVEVLEKKKVSSKKKGEEILPDGEDLQDYVIAKKLISLKSSADSRGLDFDLKFATVKRLLKTKTCYYTGKKFTKGGTNARTVDRVDATKGYVEGNVVSCTLDINAKKSNLTIDEILLIAKKIQKHTKKVKR